jgi:hypothetical protein
MSFCHFFLSLYKKEFAKIDLRFIYYTLKVNGKQEIQRNSICIFGKIEIFLPSAEQITVKRALQRELFSTVFGGGSEI